MKLNRRPPFDASREAWEETRKKNLTQWQTQEADWQTMGLPPSKRSEILELLWQSCQARARYYDEAAVTLTDRRPWFADLSSEQRREVRRQRRVFRQMLEILGEQNRHGRPRWQGRVWETAKAGLERILEPKPLPRLPKHKAGEPWVRPVVYQLAAIVGRDPRRRAGYSPSPPEGA